MSEERPARWRLIALIAGGALLALGAVYLGAVFALGDGVRPGTTVGGVPIGGMNADQAAAKLEQSLGERSTKPLKVKVADQTFTVDPAKAGLVFDAKATISAASGRVWNPITIIQEFSSSNPVEPVVTVDTEALSGEVQAIAAAVDTDPVEPTLVVDNGKVTLTPGVPGTVLDQAALAQSLQTAFLQARKPLRPELVSKDPSVSQERAIEAEKLAKAAIKSPVEVAAGTASFTVPGSAIADAISFKIENGAFVPSLDPQVLFDAVSGDLDKVGTPGRDAGFKVGKRGKLKVIPSQVGEGVQAEELAQQVTTVLNSPAGERKVTVSFGVREPEVTTEELLVLGVKEKISSFTQRFPYAAYRVQNIGQAAEYVNGTLLLPGETFSMNDTIKERTEKNGYTVGFVVGEGGVFAEELGGGVSAATTAVWTAAFFAGMERVSTRAHSIYISRYQPGLEATVAWGLFDMQFRNDTPYGVYITTKMTNTSLTVDFWSTRIYSEIAAEFGPKTDIRKYDTIYDKSKECLGQGGSDGFKINVDRVFFKDGEEVKRETVTTIYRASPQVICGKKPKPNKPDDAFDNSLPTPSPTGAHGGKPTPTPTPTPKPSKTQSESAGDPAPQVGG